MRQSNILIALVSVACLLGHKQASHCQSGSWAQYNQAGSAEFEQKHYGEAESYFSAALKEAERLPAQDPRLALSLSSLARLYARQNKTAEAEALYKRIIAIWGLKSELVADYIKDYAELLRANGRADEAAGLTPAGSQSQGANGCPPGQRVDQLAESQHAPPSTAAGWASETQLWQKKYNAGKYAEAEHLMLSALRQIDESGKDAEYLPVTLNCLIMVYYAEHKFADAEPIYNRYLMLLHKRNGPDSKEMATGLKNYAVLLRKIAKGDEAAAAEARAAAILSRQSPAVPQAAPQAGSASAGRRADSGGGIASAAAVASEQADAQPASGGSEAVQQSQPPAGSAAKWGGSPSAIPGAARAPSAESGFSARELSQATFDSEVLQSDKPVLVDFYATWCGPCQRMLPLVDQLASDYWGRAKVFRLDVDANPDLSKKYNVSTIPSLIIFKGGQALECYQGMQSKEGLAAALDKQLR